MIWERITFKKQLCGAMRNDDSTAMVLDGECWL
jgi:hypothetical protein